MTRILVVDDDNDIRHALVTIMRHQGYVVDEAASVDEALKLLERRPTLILLDIDMPVRTGIELMLEMRHDERFVKTPVVLITAYPDRSRAMQLSDVGAKEVIAKPFNLKHVVKIVQGLIGVSGVSQWTRRDAG